MGTVKYMSPEQARGVAVDARSDIFTLGSVIYEMVTGRAPFQGDTASDVIAEILKVEPPPPAEFSADLPRDLERIITKALRKDRETRYQTVRDLLIDLQDLKKEAEFRAEFQAKVQGSLLSGPLKIRSVTNTPVRTIRPADSVAQTSSSRTWLGGTGSFGARSRSSSATSL